MFWGDIFWHPTLPLHTWGTTQIKGNKMRSTIYFTDEETEVQRNWLAQGHTEPKLNPNSFNFRAVLHSIQWLPLSKGYEGHRNTCSLPPTKLPRQRRRGEFRKGIEYQKTFQNPLHEPLSTKAADMMIPMESKTPNSKDQMTLNPKDAPTAILQKLPRTGWRREAQEKRTGAVWYSAYFKPKDGGKDSISHWNNHYNTWISLKLFLKPFFKSGYKSNTYSL